MRHKGIVLIACLLAAALCGALFFVKSQPFMAQAAAVIADKATESLGAHTDIGEISLDSFNAVSVKDISLYDKEDRLFAKIDKAEIKLSPLAAITGQSPLEAINRIVVENPEVHLVQNEDESWNYSDFISDEESENNLKTTIELINAKADIEIEKNLLNVENINGTVEFINKDAITAKLAATNYNGSLEVSGTKNGSSMIGTVKAENLDFTDYVKFLPAEMTIKVDQGKLKKADVTVSTDGEVLRMNGEALILDAGLDVYDTKITGLDGLVLFNDKELRLFCRAKLEEQPLVVKGSTTLDVIEPVLNMEVSSKGFNVQSVIDTFPVAGDFAFKAQIGGKVSAPVVKADILLKDGTAEGYHLTDVVGTAQYADDKVQIDKLSGSVLGGTFNVTGTVDTKDSSYALHLDAEGLELGEIAEIAAYSITGKGGADADIYGKGTDFSAASVKGEVRVANGSYEGLSFERLTAGIFYENNSADLDYALLELAKGEVSATGKLRGDNINLKFAGHGVEMAQLAAINPSLDMRGTLDFAGTVSRTTENPWITYNFKATDGEMFSQPFTWIKGEGFGDGNRLDIKACEMHDVRGARHEISGDIGLKGIMPLNITVKTKRTRAENLFKTVLPDQKITGNVDNDLHIGGSVASPNVIGKVKLSEGSWNGLLINEASGEYSYKGDDLTIKDVVIKSPNVNLNLNGTLTDGKNLDFTVVADEIDLAKLQVRLPYPISGKANFTGILKGTTDNPDFDGTLTGDSIVLNGQSLTNVEGRLWFKNNEINLHRFAFAQDGGSFALTGLVNLNTGAIRSSLDVEKGNLANLLTMFDVENRWIDGYLDGSVVVTATYNSEAEDERMIEKPSTHIKGHLDAPRINGAALDSMEIDVLAEGPRITINKMQATADGGALSAAGEINLMEDVDVKVLGEAIPLKLLASMGGISEEASGMANIEASFKGSAKNPSGRMSLDITDGGFGTAVFDTLSCKLSLDNKIINVEKAEVTKDEYKASADGIIPLAAIMKDEGEQATVSEQMDLTVRLDDADLRILPMVSNYVEWAYGATEGKLHLTGTAANPLINGKLHLTDGMMKFQGLANPIQNMILDLDFKDDKIILNDMSGTIGAGSYKMAGTARLDGRSLGEYDFTLDAVKLDIVNKYYKGPFNGTFRLKNEGDTPSLSGSMDFADCVVDVPMLPDDDEPLPEVLLDIDVNIGSRVRLLNAQLCDVFFAGNIHAGGSTVAPDMSGEIHALRGKIYYLKTPFTVREAKAVFSQNNTFLPNITLFADTKMDRTKIIVAVTGPLDDMSFKLMSNPPMSQEQIIAALTLRSSFDRTKSDDIGTDELTDMLSIGLQMSFLNELENMVRNNIGVDEFNIVRDTISESGTSDKREVFNIEIGKYVSDRLLLRYTTGLNYSTSKVGAQYDFNTRYSLNGSVGDGKTLMLESRIKF